MMKIVTAICEDDIRIRPYESMVDTLKHTVSHYGYEVIVNTLPREKFLLTRIEEAMETFYAYDEPCIICDADVFFLQPVDLLFENPFAVGLNYRCDWHQENGRRDDINCGVVYLNNAYKSEAIKFMTDWMNITEVTYNSGNYGEWWYEQAALNRIAPEPRRPRTYNQYLVGSAFIMEMHDKIALLDNWIYGAPYSVWMTHKAKVVHYNCCVLRTKQEVKS